MQGLGDHHLVDLLCSDDAEGMLILELRLGFELLLQLEQVMMCGLVGELLEAGEVTGGVLLLLDGEYLFLKSSCM